MCPNCNCTIDWYDGMLNAVENDKKNPDTVDSCAGPCVCPRWELHSVRTVQCTLATPKRLKTMVNGKNVQHSVMRGIFKIPIHDCGAHELRIHPNRVSRTQINKKRNVSFRRFPNIHNYNDPLIAAPIKIFAASIVFHFLSPSFGSDCLSDFGFSLKLICGIMLFDYATDSQSPLPLSPSSRPPSLLHSKPNRENRKIISSISPPMEICGWQRRYRRTHTLASTEARFQRLHK